MLKERMMGKVKKVSIPEVLTDAAREVIESRPSSIDQQIELWVRVGKRTCECLTDEEVTKLLFGVAKVRCIEKMDVTLPATSSEDVESGAVTLDALQLELLAFFDGDDELMLEWLNTPLPVLAGQRPFKLIWSDSGRAEIRNLLQAMSLGEMT